MSVTLERDGEAIHDVERCEGCGQYAPYGFDVHLREAIARRDPKLAGRWFCGRNPETGEGFCKRAAAETAPDLFERVA